MPERAIIDPSRGDSPKPSPAQNGGRRRKRWAVATFHLLAAVALLLGPLPAFLEAVFHSYERDVDAAFPDHARRQLQYIEAHLQRPFDGYGKVQVILPQFAVVALSHMACGFMNVAKVEPSEKDRLAALLQETVHRALSPQVSPYRRGVEEVADLGSHGLYLSHLNLILGCYRYVSGDTRYDALHHRISAHLAAGSLADGDFHIRSYPNSAKWPADQTVTLCSLFLHDQIHGTDLSTPPIQGWRNYMHHYARDRATGLPYSSISPLPDAAIARGCALSWSALFMSQFAPDDAAELYQRYRAAYSRRILGCGGFREWPAGHDAGIDADSGPIVFGMGVSASGLGVGPARLFRDYDQYTGIMRAASVCGMPQVFGERREYRIAPILGEAILFHAVTATPWFRDVSIPDLPRDPSFSSGPVILSIGTLALAAVLLWRGWRRLIPLAPQSVD